MREIRVFPACPAEDPDRPRRCSRNVYDEQHSTRLDRAHPPRRRRCAVDDDDAMRTRSDVPRVPDLRAARRGSRRPAHLDADENNGHFAPDGGSARETRERGGAPACSSAAAAGRARYAARRTCDDAAPARGVRRARAAARSPPAVADGPLERCSCSCARRRRNGPRGGARAAVEGRADARHGTVRPADRPRRRAFAPPSHARARPPPRSSSSSAARRRSSSRTRSAGGNSSPPRRRGRRRASRRV